MRLVGTTKSTIQGIRDRTHWNAASLQPLDPVTLGLCSQIDLDLEVQPRRQGEAGAGRPRPRSRCCRPRSRPRRRSRPRSRRPPPPRPKEDLDVESVFAKLKQIGGKRDDKDDDNP